MRGITVIGLGLMVSSLAKTLLFASQAVTVWNRSHQESELLVAEGARIGVTIADAVESSPLKLVCIDNCALDEENLDPNFCIKVVS